MATSSHSTDAAQDGESWAVTFPGNLRWSNAMQIVKGMAPYGAIAMEEVDRIGDRLRAREQESDPDIAWKEEWSAMAERVWSARRFTSASLRPSVGIGGRTTISIVPGRATPVPLPMSSSVYFIATGTTGTPASSAM